LIKPRRSPSNKAGAIRFGVEFVDISLESDIGVVVFKSENANETNQIRPTGVGLFILPSKIPP